MAIDPTLFPKVLTLYLELSQYPILAPKIRARMRQELFARGVITPEAFEAEVQEKAIQSQKREGLDDPLAEEPPETWRERQGIVRDNLTDFYFAYNLPHEMFEELVRQTLAGRAPSEDVVLTFHPELAPWDMLFTQGEAYEAMSVEQRTKAVHHLVEIKVVLIKAMISDHLEYVGLAKEWLSIADLKSVRSRRIGRGKIGGKAGGMLLAEAILRKSADPALLAWLHTPRSWFLGADVFYQFTHYNELLDYANQKYRSERRIREDYPTIREQFQQGDFPGDLVAGLQGILDQAGRTPLIIRSSSLLEDSFGFSFAGKYESHFCANQGTPEENLRDLLRAIALVYASVYSPDVLLYRRAKGLLDYDERMAVLIQEVKGRREGKVFMPDAAGVAFSRNQYRWSPRIDRSAGFLRLVWGLGTRAVDQVGGDYPRLVALSHPLLRPDTEPRHIQRYSQHYVDLIDLEANALRTLPVAAVIRGRTPHLRLLAQRYRQGFLEDFVSTPLGFDPEEAVITFENLLGRTDFPSRMRSMLRTLETFYKFPVDVEFLVLLSEDEAGEVSPVIYLLQCRPQVRFQRANVRVPTDVPEEERLFVSRRLVPDGFLTGVRYVVYVSPERYAAVEPPGKAALAQVLGRLNTRLGEERFILIGPGRWGSVNPDLGIPVSYGDIYHARALVEVAGDETAPEPSYGTHFYQDLVEAQIYALALALNDPDAEFNRDFFRGSPNVLATLLPEDAAWAEVVTVIDVPAVSQGAHLELVLNGDANLAIAYLSRDEAPPVPRRE